MSTPLIIFDCDGVLVESEAIYIVAELEYLNRAGLAFERDAYVETYMGMAPNEWQASLAELYRKQTGSDLDPDFFDKLARYIRSKFESELVAVDGAREAIQNLALPTCVASSSPPELLAWKLAHTGLSELFEPHLFSTSLVSRGKPEPDLFLHAARVMGYSPEDCCVVEDSSNGVKAGKRAGMTTIGFTAASHCPVGHSDKLSRDGADVVVSSYRELADAINRLP